MRRQEEAAEGAPVLTAKTCELAGRSSRPCARTLCEGEPKRKPVVRKRSVFIRLVRSGFRP